MFDEYGIVIYYNQTHYTAHFRGSKDEICHYIEDIHIPITVFWRYSNPDTTNNPGSKTIDDIVLVDPFTGLPLIEAVQTRHPPYSTPEFNYQYLPVFDFTNTYTGYISSNEHDTWEYSNGPDKVSQRSLFSDTFSATKILRIDHLAGGSCSSSNPGGLAYNVAYGILPSIEFSFCPVLYITGVGYYNHCRTYQDYSTASFSFVPERIND